MSVALGVLIYAFSQSIAAVIIYYLITDVPIIENIGKAVVFFILTFLAVLFYINPAHESIYRQGQIDAVSGKMKYELVKQPDGQIKWKEKTNTETEEKE